MTRVLCLPSEAHSEAGQREPAFGTDLGFVRGGAPVSVLNYCGLIIGLGEPFLANRDAQVSMKYGDIVEIC